MKRLAMVAGSLAATLLACYAALLLGSWGFDTRRFAQHQGRLQRLLAQAPRLDHVVQGLENEGSPLLAAPRGEREVRQVAWERGGLKSREILEKGRLWPQTRVFAAGDMVYFLYFDREGVMRDFTCVSR
jgi:hypothetical protein